MAIDPFLSEAKWKTVALPMRTTGEKLKHKKTGVSEALHAYAAVGDLGVEHGPDKEDRLKAVKAALVRCKADHRTNRAFVAYIDNVEKGVVREAARINKAADALTLAAILGNPGAYTAFHAYCTNTEHNPEPLEFLHDVHANVAAAALINTYIRAGSAKEVNIDETMRQAWIDAPGDAAARKVIVDWVGPQIEANELRRYKVRMKVTV